LLRIVRVYFHFPDFGALTALQSVDPLFVIFFSFIFFLSYTSATITCGNHERPEYKCLLIFTFLQWQKKDSLLSLKVLEKYISTSATLMKKKGEKNTTCADPKVNDLK